MGFWANLRRIAKFVLFCFIACLFLNFCFLLGKDCCESEENLPWWKNEDLQLQVVWIKFLLWLHLWEFLQHFETRKKKKLGLLDTEKECRCTPTCPTLAELGIFRHSSKSLFLIEALRGYLHLFAQGEYLRIIASEVGFQWIISLW